MRDLQDAIHAAAAQTPLAIVLEDIHWADSGTLLALRSLATTQPDAAVLWVVTARTGAGGPAVQETLAVLQRANATFVRVPAMSASAVADMVQDAVRANADESLLNLAVKAQGNPFLVRELVGGLWRRAGLMSVAAERWPPGTTCRDVCARACSSDWTCSPMRPQRRCGLPPCFRPGSRLGCWPQCWNVSRRR